MYVEHEFLRAFGWIGILTYRMKATVLGVAAIVLVATTLACEPIDGGGTFTFENRTAKTLTFYFEPGADALVRFSLGPFQTTTVAMLRSSWKGRLIARDPAGNIVFDKRITYEELKKMERVVIEPPQ